MAAIQYKKGILQINKANSREDAEDRVAGIRTINGHVFSHIIETSKGFEIHSIFEGIKGGPQRTQRTVYWPAE